MEKIEQTVGFDEIEAEEAALLERRLRLYSKAAIKAGKVVDAIIVAHTSFSTGLNLLDRLYQIAPELNMPHGACIVGPTGTGKSALFRIFRETLPQSSLFERGYGAIGLRLGPRPTAGQILSALLRVFHYPFRTGSRSTIYARYDILVDLLREKGTRLLFVDEANRLVNQQKVHNDAEPTATQIFIDLMEDCRIGIAFAGTDALHNLQKVDAALADRLSVRHQLNYFEPDEQFLALIKSFHENCSVFDLDFLLKGVQPRLLHNATGGSPRRIKRLLTEAVLIAVEAKKSCLDQAVLQDAYRLVQGADAVNVNPYESAASADA